MCHMHGMQQEFMFKFNLLMTIETLITVTSIYNCNRHGINALPAHAYGKIREENKNATI
jgi:hypothetical protein